MSARPRCSKCHVDMDVGVLIVSNGQRAYLWYCELCQSEGEKLRREEKERFEELLACAPIVRDNRSDCCEGDGCERCARRSCERCGSYKRLQYHHFAPQALFADADFWPGAVLCQRCHSLWHAVMTPGMRSRPDEASKAYVHDVEWEWQRRRQQRWRWSPNISVAFDEQAQATGYRIVVWGPHFTSERRQALKQFLTEGAMNPNGHRIATTLRIVEEDGTHDIVLPERLCACGGLFSQVSAEPPLMVVGTAVLSRSARVGADQR